MKNITAIAAATIAALSFNAFAENYPIKGYSIGQQMSACPENSVTEKQGVLRACRLGSTTYAGAGARDLMIMIYNDQIIAVMVQLEARGRHANSGVLEAMKEKFGNPTISKDHINTFMWRRGSLMLSFDGYAGSVLSVDTEKYGEATKNQATTNKDDL